jgi:hypothetical protein
MCDPAMTRRSRRAQALLKALQGRAFLHQDRKRCASRVGDGPDGTAAAVVFGEVISGIVPRSIARTTGPQP